MINDEQKKILASLSNSILVDFIVDTHGVDKVLDKKIERLLLQADKPKLIKKLTTAIKSLKRRSKFVDYWESSEFAIELEFLKRDVMSLQQTHPKSCFDLIHLFMETTNKSIERCDDSNGEVGDVYRELSECWLQLAKVCYTQEKEDITASEQDFLSQAWIEKVKKVMEDNEYRLKDNILFNINQVLDKHEIKNLIEDYEQTYDDLVIEAEKEKNQKQKTENKTNRYFKNQYVGHFFDIDYEHTKKFDYKISELARYLEYLAEALEDVTMFERLYLKHRPKRPLNPRQLESLLTFMLEQDEFDLALGYLDNEWHSQGKRDEVEKLDWLAKTYAKQGNFDKQLQMLGEAFAINASTQRFKEIMAISKPGQQAKLRTQALELAKNQDDVINSVALLVEVGEIDLANNMAVTRQTEFEGVHYNRLTELLGTLPEGADLIQIICYRSLIDDILNSGRSKAYNIAARYLDRLNNLDVKLNKLCVSYNGIKSHKVYIDSLKSKHGKKSSFWEKVAK
ncbi:DUF6880 family protein [Psychrobacter sp.]|uniref:DUF6880 family protein n=1 Tax=Psychrobacter sp. TaxID=56811 RepID=UPI0025D2F55C|nr:DUF6880 family protein [Psychrobacter sp.]